MSTTGFDSIPFGQGEGYNGVGEGWQGSLFGGDPNMSTTGNSPIDGSPSYGPGGGPFGSGGGLQINPPTPISPVGGLRPIDPVAPRLGGGAGGAQSQIKPFLTQLLGSIFGLPQRQPQPGRPRPVSRPVDPRDPRTRRPAQPITRLQPGPVRMQNPPTVGPGGGQRVMTPDTSAQRPLQIAGGLQRR